MMLLSIIITILSCLIQGIVSNYLGYTFDNISVFSTLYILIALLIVSPYFENEKKYLIILIIFGLIVDIAYTSTPIFNTAIFILVYYFSKVFHFFLPYNLFTININNLLCVFIYHIITFLFLIIFKYDSFSIWVLIKILTHSIFMTIIYTSIIYILIKFLKEKFDLREVK